jgi:hypothetical protein
MRAEKGEKIMTRLSRFEEDYLSLFFYAQFQKKNPIPARSNNGNYPNELLKWERKRLSYITRCRENLLSFSETEVVKLLHQCSLLPVSP